MSRLWKPAPPRVEDLVLADGTPADDAEYPDVVHAGRRVIPSSLLADVTSAARLGQSPTAAKVGAGKAIRKLPFPDAPIDDVPAARWLELLHEEEVRRQRRLTYNPPASEHHAQEAGKPWRAAGELEVQKDLNRARPIAFQKRILAMAQQTASALRRLWRLPRSAIDGTSLAGTLNDGFHALAKMTSALEARRKAIQGGTGRIRECEESLDGARALASGFSEKAAAARSSAAAMLTPPEDESAAGKGKGKKGKGKGKKPSPQELDEAAAAEAKVKEEAAALEAQAEEFEREAASIEARIAGELQPMLDRAKGNLAALQGAEGRTEGSSGGGRGRSSGLSGSTAATAGGGGAGGAVALLGDLGGTRRSRRCVRHGVEDVLSLENKVGVTSAGRTSRSTGRVRTEAESKVAASGRAGAASGGGVAPEEAGMAEAAGLTPSQLRSMRVYEAALRFDLDALGRLLGMEDGRPFDVTVVGVWT